MGNNFNSVSAPRLVALTVARKEVTTANVVADGFEVPSEVSDEALFTRIVAGEHEGLAFLFRRYARMVHVLGRRILRDPVEAEDLVQEVFLYIHRKSALFDSTKGSARSWIIQVAYTQALLRRRQLKVQGFYVSGVADRAVECEQAIRGAFLKTLDDRKAKRSSDKGAHYDHTVEGLFGRNGWKKIVEDLTADQRETFRLHFFEGYTFGEIAEKLGQSFANIRNHHYRGLEKLRKHLANNELNRR